MAGVGPRGRSGRLVTIALWLAGCAGGAATPALGPADYDARQPLNPTTDAGQIVHLSFGSHHPSCFVMVGDRDTEDVDCPEAARVVLEHCQAGTLYPGQGAAEGACVCVPISGDPERVACP